MAIATGVLGLILPPLMVVFGVLTLFDSIRRNGVPIPPELMLAGDLSELLLFVVMTAWGLALRRSPAAHKRLMIMGTLAIMGPAINRWPFPPSMRLSGTIAVALGLPLLVVAYDVWSLRRVHWATIFGTAMITVAGLGLVPMANLPIWEPLITWIRHT